MKPVVLHTHCEDQLWWLSQRYSSSILEVVRNTLLGRESWAIGHHGMIAKSSLVLRVLSQSEMGYSLKPLSTVKWGFTTTKRYPRSLFPVFMLGKSAEVETMEENQDQH